MITVKKKHQFWGDVSYGKVTRSSKITHRSQHPNHKSGRYSYCVASLFQHTGISSHQLWSKTKKKPLELFGLDTESYANYKPFIHFRVIAITEIRTVDETFTEYQLI